MTPIIPLYWEKFQIGDIVADEQGVRLVYEQRWQNSKGRGAFPVSLTMPLDAREHDALSWLGNLLPEAEALKTVGRRLGIAPEDAIGMLSRIGRDTAGALSIEVPHGTKSADWRYRRIPDDAALERIINELPAKPFLVGDEGVSMSLAGVQEKLPIALLDLRPAIPLHDSPSTHILKPAPTDRLFGAAHNEALCLLLALRCGIPAAEAITGRAGERTYLLVTRYDRRFVQDHWRRLHQEDFCQALSKPPSAKYERNQSGIKGPRLTDMFGLVDRHMTAADKVRLLDAVVFNVLICNTDSHAKNYSALFVGSTVTLAPLYDLMCADCWDGVTKNMAQTIADKDRGGYLYGRHWQRMARACGLNPTSSLQRVEVLADKVIAALPGVVAEVEAMPAGPHPMLREFEAAIVRRCGDIRRQLRERDGEQRPP